MISIKMVARLSKSELLRALKPWLIGQPEGTFDTFSAARSATWAGNALSFALFLKTFRLYLWSMVTGALQQEQI